MTKIDFYILSNTTIEARLDFACRLVETIYRKGHGLHVHTESEQQARDIDERLWTFRPDSYVPHGLIDASETPTPVTIGWHEPPAPQASDPQAMLNLHPEIPEWFSRFERVAEVINQHQDVLASKRDCWQTYKRRGYPVKAHHLK